VKISNIKKSKYFSFYYCIILDEENNFIISENLINKLKLHFGQEIDETVYQKIKKNEFAILQKYSTRYFKKFKSSIATFEKKLIIRNFSKENINNIIEWLKKEELLNDREYCLNVILDLINSSKYSRKELEHKLKQRKLNTDIIKEYLEKFYTDENEIETIKSLKNKLEKKYKEYKKILQYLLSKGFTYSNIKKSFELDKNRFESAEC